MPDSHTRGEIHGCIVCGKPYQLYAVYNAEGRFIDCKVMSPGAKCVQDARRPLVACDHHSEEQIDRAMKRVFGSSAEGDE